MSTSLKEIGAEAFDWTTIFEVEIPWTTPIDADFSPFPDGIKVYVPMGSLAAHKANKRWAKYKLIEKENCASGPISFVNEDTVIVGKPETQRVVLIEKPQRKHHWILYGMIITSKPDVDLDQAAKKLLFEAFRSTAMFLDWEEDNDFGSAPPLSDIMEYNTHRYAVIDLAEDSSLETKIFDGRTYLIDEEFYNSVIKDDRIEWIRLSNS